MQMLRRPRRLRCTQETKMMFGLVLNKAVSLGLDSRSAAGTRRAERPNFAPSPASA